MKAKKYEVLHEKDGEPSILLVSHAFKSGTTKEEQKQTIQAFQDVTVWKFEQAKK